MLIIIMHIRIIIRNNGVHVCIYMHMLTRIKYSIAIDDILNLQL